MKNHIRVAYLYETITRQLQVPAVLASALKWTGTKFQVPQDKHQLRKTHSTGTGIAVPAPAPEEQYGPHFIWRHVSTTVRVHTWSPRAAMHNSTNSCFTVNSVTTMPASAFLNNTALNPDISRSCGERGFGLRFGTSGVGGKAPGGLI